MRATASLVDVLLDDPGLKFVNCYYKIPVFKKLSAVGATGRFWFAFSIGAERVIILGPSATRPDLNYALAFLIAHPLPNHFIACNNNEAATVVDFQSLKMVDGVVKIAIPE